MADKPDNAHRGHRERMKQRCLEEGLDNFAEHQVLELLLFYALPYKDVNALAHTLLAHYGSFAAVLDADYYQLMDTPGIGPNTASLLASMPEFFRRYQLGKQSPRATLATCEEAGRYAVNMFIGANVEQFYVISLDAQRQVTKAALISEGTIDRVSVNPRRAVEVALRYKAHGVLLAHNHPSGSLRPSAEDIDLTKRITAALNAINIIVYDHLIVAENKYISFADLGLIGSAY